MYLSANKSLNSSYHQALKEFYQARMAEEELQLKEQKESYTKGLEQWKNEMKERKLQDPDFVVPKEPAYLFGRRASAKFMEKERLELAEGLSHRKSLLESFEQEYDTFPTRDFSSLSYSSNERAAKKY